MNLNEYQEAAKKTAKYPSKEYPFICLSEEAGEVSGKIAKFMRSSRLTSVEAIEAAASPTDMIEVKLRDDLVKELGDCLWEIAMCAEELGVDLEEVAKRNIDKLASRKRRGVIDGSGDDR